jgi:hypothetical protein
MITSKFNYLLFLMLLMGCSISKNVFKNDKVFLVYNSDHEAPEKITGLMQFEYESVYAMPLSKYSYSRQPKGIRISDIGYKRDPVWNKRGNKVAFLSYEEADTLSFNNGQIIIKNVLDNSTKVIKDTDVLPLGLSWDASGSILAFGETDNRVSIYNLKREERQTLFRSKSKPEGISISPDGKHIIFMTRDGIDGNDEDGWRPNLFTIGEKNIIKIGGTNDKFGILSNFWWKDDSSQVIFNGFILDEKNNRFYNYWAYNLKTQELNPYLGDLKKFQKQRVRYWKADKLY